MAIYMFAYSYEYQKFSVPKIAKLLRAYNRITSLSSYDLNYLPTALSTRINLDKLRHEKLTLSKKLEPDSFDTRKYKAMEYLLKKENWVKVERYIYNNLMSHVKQSRPVVIHQFDKTNSIDHSPAYRTLTI